MYPDPDLHDIASRQGGAGDGTNFTQIGWQVTLSDEDNLIAQNPDLFVLASPEKKAAIIVALEQQGSRNYIQICEKFYYWRKFIEQEHPEDGARRFYLEVEGQMKNKKQGVVDQYLQFYRNIYQRAWNDISDREEVSKTILECIIALTNYEIRRYLAHNKNACYWEFKNADIVLRDCVGEGTSIRDIATLDDLIRLMQPSSNDPIDIPDEETEDEEAGIDLLFGVRSSECRQWYSKEERDGVQLVTHFIMLNCCVVENRGRESVPEPIKGMPLAAYLRYDSIGPDDSVIEENRYAFIYDDRHGRWNEIGLEDYRLI